jgi:hypothetical protein
MVSAFRRRFFASTFPDIKLMHLSFVFDTKNTTAHTN